jgi:lysophospholipase L1-like esterase
MTEPGGTSQARFIVAAVVLAALGVASYLYWSMGKAGTWEPAIRKFEESDRKAPPKPGVIVFTGSSSIRFWKTLPDDMKPLDVINRGFGGSQIEHVNEYASRIVIPYRPRAVVLYAGDNDLSWPWSKSPEAVFADFQEFVSIVHGDLPDTWIYYISIKPSKLRWTNWTKIQATNRMIRDFAASQERVQFIDVASAMLDAQGHPRADLLRIDGLHPNAKCYALWTSIIKPVLMERFAAPGSPTTSAAMNLH